MFRIWSIAAGETWNNFRKFSLAILLSWLVAGVAGGAVPDVAPLAQTGLLFVCLPFYSHAAARIAGFNEEWASWHTPPRPGIEVEPLTIALGMLFLAAAGFGTGYLIGGESGAYAGLAVIGLVFLGLLVRVWPMFSVPYFFKGRFRWSPAAGGLMWHGPGIGRAWKLTRQSLAMRLINWAFLIPMFGLLLPLLALRLLWGPSFFINLLFYAVCLPYLSVLNLRMTAVLLSEEEDLQKSGQ